MKRSDLVMMVSSMAMLAACSQDPARLVNGYGLQPMTGYPFHAETKPTPAQSASQPLVSLESRAADPAEVTGVVAASTTPVKTAAMKEESLASISPAAGPVVNRAVSQPVAVAKPAPQPTTVKHTVAATDTGYKLARTYNTSVEQILKDNNLKSIADIKEGQTLTIAQNSKPQYNAWDDMKKMLSEGPAADSSTPAERKAAAFARKQDERIAALGQDVAVAPATAQAPVQQVAAVDESKLSAIEPAAGPAKADPVQYLSHTVEPKETIYRISLKYNVSVLDIMAANEFTEPQDLKADTVIKVPVKSKTVLVATNKDKVVTPGADVAPAAGDVEPVQVAMISTKDDLDSKAVKQDAQKDAVLAVKKDVQVTPDFEAMAEQKRGLVDRDAARSSGLVWPVKGEVIRRFGDDGSGVARTGINIAVPKGTAVLASEGGKVLYADDGLKIYGKMVLIRHDNGMVSAYAHNSYLLVRKNERVKKGQVIALSGASGNVESPQLHFELRQHASAVDPIAMLPRM